MTCPPPAVEILLLASVAVAALWDFRVRRIPNWLVLTALVLGVALNAFLYGSAGLRLSLSGMGLALLVYFPLYALRAMGAGDVKLMAALGAIVGAADWFGIFILTGLFGGVCALALMGAKGRVRKTLWNVGYLLNEFVHLRAPYITRDELDVKSSNAVTMPHGVIISLGAVAFLIAGHIWA